MAFRKLFLFFVALALITPSSAFVGHRNVIASTTALASAASTSTDVMPEVKVGDTIPDVPMKELVTGTDGPVEVKLGDLLKGKKVAIFGVPGAFTPGCSKSHLPSFMDAQEELKGKGVDFTICVATNDAFVMEVRQDTTTCCLCQLMIPFLTIF